MPTKKYSTAAYLKPEEFDLFEKLVHATAMTNSELGNIVTQTESAIITARKKHRFKKIFANEILQSDLFKERRDRLSSQISLLAEHQKLKF